MIKSINGGTLVLNKENIRIARLIVLNKENIRIARLIDDFNDLQQTHEKAPGRMIGRFPK
jgi:hypothetical protein